MFPSFWSLGLRVFMTIFYDYPPMHESYKHEHEQTLNPKPINPQQQISAKAPSSSSRTSGSVQRRSRARRIAGRLLPSFGETLGFVWVLLKELNLVTIIRKPYYILQTHFWVIITENGLSYHNKETILPTVCRPSRW